MKQEKEKGKGEGGNEKRAFLNFRLSIILFSLLDKQQGSIDFLFAESLNRAERKRLERLNKFNFDVQGNYRSETF